MEMPDVIYLFRNSNGGLELGPAPDYCDWLVNVTYHHNRIVETLRRENEELKASVNILEQKLRDVNKAHDRAEAKLEKAIKGLKNIAVYDMYHCSAVEDTDFENQAEMMYETARTTLEEIG